jgi:hypothetical protein
MVVRRNGDISRIVFWPEGRSEICEIYKKKTARYNQMDSDYFGEGPPMNDKPTNEDDTIVARVADFLRAHGIEVKEE